MQKKRFPASIPILLLALWLSFPLPVLSDNPIATSPHDTREYAAFTLPNRLRVLVISDPETDKAACALDVLVGTHADPESRPGLAHFLEHMLFLGTEKYPAPDAFSSFITKHGGTQNAYTDAEHTNYFFDVGEGHLREALDRFGQFFIAPTLDPAYVARERSAVDAEFHAKRQEDAWRARAVRRQVMNPGHPASRFGVGNLATLSDKGDRNIREELMAFYRRYYSANLMALVVFGREPVAVLGQWAREVFSQIPDTGAKPLEVTAPLFAPGRLPARVVTRPVKERRELRLSFPVPAVLPHHKTKPLYYIAHLLGHEGEGSLLSLLKARGLAEGLTAGKTHSHRDSALFTVSITLTEQGMDEVDAIAGLVFETIDLIEARGVREWLFQELAQLAELDFLFPEKLPPRDYASALAELLQQYPTQHVLRAAMTLEDYDEGLIRRYLAALNPDNVLMVVTDPDAPDEEKQEASVWSETPRFRAPYGVRAMEPALLETWRTGSATDTDTAPALAIPEPNPFIPEDLSLASATHPQDRPVRLVDIPGLTLWFQQDASYGRPRANFYFSVRSPVANDIPVHSVSTDLITALVEDQLAEFTYPATLAGLEYEIYPHLRGISVRIEGYHDKQMPLLARILDALRQPKLLEARFRIAKDELTRKLRNRRKALPYRQAIRELDTLLLKPRWTPDALLAALEPVTLPELRAFAAEFFRRIALVALSHGNVDETDARAMADLLNERLLRDAEPTPVPRARVVRLGSGMGPGMGEGSAYLRAIAPEHSDAAIAVYLQGRDRSFPARGEMALLAQLLESAFFNRLRTDQQLGYVVSATAYSRLEVPGLLFLIQSPHTDPPTLAARVEEFLTGHAQVLNAMTPAEFQGHRAVLVARILEHEESLGVRSERYWREIDRDIDQGAEAFDSRERLAKAVGEITLARIRRVYETEIRGEARRRLMVYAAGSLHGEEQGRGDPAEEGGQGVLIQDTERFKEGQGLFPAEGGVFPRRWRPCR